MLDTHTSTDLSELLIHLRAEPFELRVGPICVFRDLTDYLLSIPTTSPEARNGDFRCQDATTLSSVDLHRLFSRAVGTSCAIMFGTFILQTPDRQHGQR